MTTTPTRRTRPTTRTTPTTRTVSLGTALLGGVAWVANLFVGSDLLSIVGAALLGLAVLLVGSRLARQAWLGAITSVGSLALCWSLLDLLSDAYDDRVLEAVVGGVASLVVAIAVARGPGAPSPDDAVVKRGNHRG